MKDEANEAGVLTEVERLRAEVEMLRGVGCGEVDGTDEDGPSMRGPCGVCIKCARRERDVALAETKRLESLFAYSGTEIVKGLLARDELNVRLAAVTEEVERLRRIERAALAWATPSQLFDAEAVATVSSETVRNELRRLGFRCDSRPGTDSWSHPATEYRLRYDHKEEDWHVMFVVEAVRAVAQVRAVSPVVVLAEWLPKDGAP